MVVVVQNIASTYNGHFLANDSDIWSAEVQQSSDRSNASTVYQIALVIKKV